jgi:hypothetical protein
VRAVIFLRFYFCNLYFNFLGVFVIEPDIIAFDKWKSKWNERMELLSLREDRYSYDYILACFNARKGEKKICKDSLYKDKRKIDKDISIDFFLLLS